MCDTYRNSPRYPWRNGASAVTARLREDETITNHAEGIVLSEIPKRSGLTNQEAQAVDQEGGVHVLSRESLDRREDGAVWNLWKHYDRSPKGERAFPNNSETSPIPLPGARRDTGTTEASQPPFLTFRRLGTWSRRRIGPVAGSARGRLAISKTGDLYRASKGGGYATYEEAWKGDGLEHGNVLSARGRNVAVLGFQLSTLPRCVRCRIEPFAHKGAPYG
ncbi:hypothetical protein VTH06DRAFT_5229 [Thermothelomyces fergusii]